MEMLFDQLVEYNSIVGDDCSNLRWITKILDIRFAFRILSDKFEISVVYNLKLKVSPTV